MRLSARMIATAAFAVISCRRSFSIRAGRLLRHRKRCRIRRPGYRHSQAELFLGYSYVQAVPKLAAGNRCMAEWRQRLHRLQPEPASGHRCRHWRLHELGDTIPGRIWVYSRRERRGRGCPQLSLWSALFLPAARQFTPFAQVLFGGAHASEVVLTPARSVARFSPLKTRSL